MQESELRQLVNEIVKRKTETKNLEVKSARAGAPKLYESLSAFSNTEGGTIVLGIDETSAYKVVGVYNAHDLQTKIAEQCKEMEPEVRAVISHTNHQNLDLVSVEVPEMEYSVKPCFHKSKGQRKGSYTRIGNTNEQLSEYEIYSYDAFKRQICDDIREIERAKNKPVEQLKLESYLLLLKTNRPNLATRSTQDLLKINSFMVDDVPTLIYVMLFSIYPQAILPNLCINAVVVPGYELGETTTDGERFIDNKKIEGTLSEQIEGAIAFVRRNMSTKTHIDKTTGRRTDITEYPLDAIRESILNAVVHRDYSFHTENKPIQVYMYKDRIEITNPGGLYGRLTVDDLGKFQPDTRNPNIAKALELLKVTENRYSGIPTIKRRMEEYGLPEPVFINERGSFQVVLYNDSNTLNKDGTVRTSKDISNDILTFCKTPRSLTEIADFLGLKTNHHVRYYYLNKLVEQGEIKQTIPDKPGSKFQRYITV